MVGRLRVRGEVLLHGAKGLLPVVRGSFGHAAVLGKDALVNEGQTGGNVRAGAGLLLAHGLKSRSRRVSREGRRDGDLRHLVGGKAGVGIDALPADLGGPPGGSHIAHGAVGALDDGQAVHHAGADAAGERRGDALGATGHALAERDAVDVVLGDLAVVVGGVRRRGRCRSGGRGGRRRLGDAHVARLGRVLGGLLVKVLDGEAVGDLGGDKPGCHLLLVATGTGPCGAGRAADSPHNQGSTGDAKSKRALGGGQGKVGGILQREGMGHLRRHKRHRAHQSGKDGRIPLHLHA